MGVIDGLRTMPMHASFVPVTVRVTIRSRSWLFCRPLYEVLALLKDSFLCRAHRPRYASSCGRSVPSCSSK